MGTRKKRQPSPAASTRELKNRVADRVTQMIGLRSCECGPRREPHRVLENGISYLVCGVCGGRTTELKY